MTAHCPRILSSDSTLQTDTVVTFDSKMSSDRRKVAFDLLNFLDIFTLKTQKDRDPFVLLKTVEALTRQFVDAAERGGIELIAVSGGAARRTPPAARLR